MDAIKSSKKLTCLVLEGNTLGVDAAKAIGKALESQPHFERALWKDAFTGRLKDEIPTALVKTISKLFTSFLIFHFFRFRNFWEEDLCWQMPT